MWYFNVFSDSVFFFLHKTFHVICSKVSLPFSLFWASRWVSGQSLSLLERKPFAWFSPFSWERDCPETHLIGCSAGALYKVSWIFLFVVFFATVRFVTTSWWLINTRWVTLVNVHNVERPETPNDLGKNITDNVVRSTWGCIPWNYIYNWKFFGIWTQVLVTRVRKDFKGW